MSEQNKEQQAPEASEVSAEDIEQVSGGQIIDTGCILLPPTDPPPFY